MPKQMRRVSGRRIGMIFQNPASHLDPVMSIGRQIAESLRFHRGAEAGEARRAAVDLLRQVGIPDPERRADDYPHQFSGGMRQRAMIALALACEPDLLIADEPTTALDVTVQAQILRLLLDLRDRRGLSIILITHDLGVVAQTCDTHRRDVCRAHCASAAPSAMCSPVRSIPIRRELIACQPAAAMPGRLLPSIPGQPPLPSSFPAGCRFHPRCDRADRPLPRRSCQPWSSSSPADAAACHRRCSRAARTGR